MRLLSLLKSLKKSVVENSNTEATPSPAASKILNEKNIPLSSVKGTGRGGRITKEDAIKALPKIDLNSIAQRQKYRK